MEILNIQQWLENGLGGGGGPGAGYGYGDGSGSGAGSGAGSGSGSGCGGGSGYGYGDGSNTDVKSFCGRPVYVIDCTQTIITAIFGDVAKGYILHKDLTLTPCYIAKKESYFAHGETLSEALAAVMEKVFEDMPEEERIAEFWKCHQKGVKYPAKDFYEWHHKLTGSCEMGRKNFAAEHGIDLTKDEFTVDEFIKLCCNSYGGEVISKLLEA